ncbi:MAG: hypothetical protein ABJD97_06205 [Betaproteobacteria bacterium]
MRIHTTPGCGPRPARFTRRRHDFGAPHGRGDSLRTFVVCVLAVVATLTCIAFDPTASMTVEAKPPALPAAGAAMAE